MSFPLSLSLSLLSLIPPNQRVAAVAPLTTAWICIRRPCKRLLTDRRQRRRTLSDALKFAGEYEPFTLTNRDEFLLLLSIHFYSAPSPSEVPSFYFFPCLSSFLPAVSRCRHAASSSSSASPALSWPPDYCSPHPWPPGYAVHCYSWRMV
ncbi:hypothetical protein BDA96_06G055900 [Sorghum bicolor]|uniref:Uncharacterized protein n=2 Tax=Sorghum bicolor TaxID=4558 RepID=A0A921QRA0_SORBI|nr:hypothetical protein BDA96_06G055900 [Sorghum bicolor]OQU81384.1 hypothetical protein SORBI_3006G050050 [Sorghum bicolor]